MPTSFDMTFAPTAQLVSVLRRFILSLYERILDDPETSSQLALVTHELLENAVKYNVDDTTLLRVNLTPTGADSSDCTVTIRTRNRASPENIQSAQRIIACVREAEDPFLFYQQLIQASTALTEGSGLGLARIRAETDMTIDITVEGDQIELIAQAQLTTDGGEL